MGGYSSDSGSDRGRKKKSRRRRSSSSSSSASSHSRVSSRKGKSRSKRDSPDRRYHSNKSSRSRSHSKDRRAESRSSSTQSYSSNSRSRHSRRSRSRSRDRKDGKDSKRESKSDKSSKKGYGDDSSKRKHGTSSSFITPLMPLEAKSPEEQLKLKMQLALKAAADADKALREQGILPGKGKDWNHEQEEEKPLASSRLPQLSGIEQMDRAKAVDIINAPGFQQASFRTGSKTATPSQVGEKFSLGSHDAAMFGVGTDPNIPGLDGFGTASAAKIVIDKDSIAHENLFVDPAIKEERWIRKLMFMRQRKLNGEAMMF